MHIVVLGIVIVKMCTVSTRPNPEGNEYLGLLGLGCGTFHLVIGG